MVHRARRPLRPLADSFVVPGPSGVAVRTRLKHLTAQDEKVLRVVGGHLGSLASGDLAARCRDGVDHDKERWAQRKRELTVQSSSRWAGSITKATHDQWALARRGQAAHLASLETGVRTVAERLAQPLGAKGTKNAPGGYRSRREWFGKARRLAVLEHRLAKVRQDWETGTVHVVRGGRKLMSSRHHLQQAGLTQAEWRRTHLANAPHGRHVLDSKAAFAHRGGEWADRVCADRAVAYRIHHDVERGRWYVTASWTRTTLETLPLQAARAKGMVGVDMNADHLAAYRLDGHGNPTGNPERFSFELSGSASRRDAQVRHALTRLLHWTRRTGAKAIGIEDLDFTTEKTREKHGRKKRFRQLISGMPTARLRARIVSMAAEQGLAVVAVDPAYTSKWGAQHWAKPLNNSKRTMTRHGAAAVAIGRRALGHPVRRRTAPPPTHRSDGYGPRTVQTGHDAQGVRDPAAPPRNAHTMRAAGQGTRERGRPARPTPFGTRPVPGRGSKTHSCTLVRNGFAVHPQAAHPRMQEGLAVHPPDRHLVLGPDAAEVVARGPQAFDEPRDHRVAGPAARGRAQVGDELAGVAFPVLGRGGCAGFGVGEPAVRGVAAVAGEAGLVAHEQERGPVLGEDLAQVGQHQGRGSVERVEHPNQPGAGQAGHLVGRRGPVAGQVEEVVALVVGQAQRPGQRTEQLHRRLAAAALFEAHDIVHRHAGEHGHLLPAQAAGASAGPVDDADLARAHRFAAAAQKVGELVALHGPMILPVAEPVQGAALPG